MTAAPAPALLSERDALAAVAAAARAQLDALASGDVGAFEAAAARTFDAVAELGRCQHARRRAGAPPDAPDAALREAAADARAACDTLALALGDAAALGADLLGVWTQRAAPPTHQVYTAHGRVGPSDVPARLRETG